VIIESLKALISNGCGSKEENDTLLTLLRVAQEDDKIREQIMTIVNLNALNRKKVVDLLVVYLKNRNAPDKFIGAILSLEKESIVNKIRGVL